ncbi:MAG: hypothetical protein ACM31M_06295 [Nitrososphaerota archaeon]|jgi:hypothetical protein
MLKASLAEQLNEDQRQTPAACRIDYNYFNYCSTCELKYPKEILRCIDCNQKVRTRPWHRSKKFDEKRI